MTINRKIAVAYDFYIYENNDKKIEKSVFMQLWILCSGMRSYSSVFSTLLFFLRMVKGI